MSWPTVKLGEVMTVGRGSSPRPIKDERFFTGGTIPWVKIADATASGKFIYKTNQHVNDYGASFSRRLKPGALIFPASGTLGIPRFLGVEACIHDGWLYFSDFQGIDPDWLYYRIILLKDYYEGIAYGAAIQNINTDIVRNTKIQLPDLATQRAMTAVLSAYDDLIATNQRRIALLEDAARRLYREWFMNLRFPGHESVPVTDGVPEGWRISTFGEQVSIRKGKNLTRSSVIPGEIPVVAAGLEPMCYHNAANAKGPVITISASGANAGYVRLYHEDIWASDCSYISNDVTDDLYFFYCALKERQTEILLMQKGAAQPHVYPKDIQAMDMIWPCHEVVALFQEHVASMFAFCGALLMQSDQLAQARDLLLPKLMSGQLDVSGIRLPEEVAA